ARRVFPPARTEMSSLSVSVLSQYRHRGVFPQNRALRHRSRAQPPVADGRRCRGRPHPRVVVLRRHRRPLRGRALRNAMDAIVARNLTKTYRVRVGRARVREMLPWPADRMVARTFPKWWTRDAFDALKDVSLSVPVASS